MEKRYPAADPDPLPPPQPHPRNSRSLDFEKKERKKMFAVNNQMFDI